MDNKEYGIKFADVCVSFNHTRHLAGGSSLTVNEMLDRTIVELFNTMARNGLRFTFYPPEVDYDALGSKAPIPD